MADQPATLGFVGALIMLLAGCATQVMEVPRTGAPAPAELPEGYYHQLAAQGTPVFRVDPAGSLVIMEVRRAGSLAQLGHDHVVVSHDVAGYLV